MFVVVAGQGRGWDEKDSVDVYILQLMQTINFKSGKIGAWSFMLSHLVMKS